VPCPPIQAGDVCASCTWRVRILGDVRSVPDGPSVLWSPESRETWCGIRAHCRVGARMRVPQNYIW